jgi:hypothetical protein
MPADVERRLVGPVLGIGFCGPCHGHEEALEYLTLVGNADGPAVSQVARAILMPQETFI